MNSWYSITNKAPDSAEVMIYNEIGAFGITAEAFVNELKDITAKNLSVRINSPGGDCFDAFAIFNALKNYKGRVTTSIDGLAASAATVIMLAGSEVNIAANGYLMIHCASSGVWGGADDMMKAAALLEKLNLTIAETYAQKTGKTPEEMLAIVQEETWFNADEAKAAGLVDNIDGEGDMPAAVAHAVVKFKKAPENLRRIAASLLVQNGPSEPPKPSGDGAKAANVKEVLMNLDSFKAFAAEHPEAVSAYREEGKKLGVAEAHQSELARFKAVRDACGGNDALACDLFSAGKDAEDAKLTLAALAKTEAKAKADAEAAAAALAAKDAEIERLKAQAGTQGAIGTSGAAANAVKDTSTNDADLSPEARAEKEFDSDEKIQDDFTKVNGSKDSARRAYVKWKINAERGRTPTPRK
jgi:ATP-dependent protease ClpP protease subunit